MEPLRDAVARQRARYMNNEISHQEYYLWLAEVVGITEAMIPFSRERVIASTDPHMNDLPLARWDGVHGLCQCLAFSRDLPWSLCDTVCCLKALAQRIRTEAKVEVE